jgi:ATP-dependent protease ClpP protease subunit
MFNKRKFAGLDKEAAAAQWREQFNNRTPIAREPGKVEVKAAADGVTDLMIYDEIGFFGVTAKEFNTALAQINTPNVRVRVNSPGGDVFEGLAIYSALKEHPARITCQVDGIAASAASFIALAADEVVMAENALMMVHNAWGLSIGNKADMLETATILEKIDAQLADIYAKKTGKPVAEIAAMMDGEGKADGTWFTAQEALDYGLVDSLMTPDEDKQGKAKNSADEHIRAMRRRLALVAHDD